MKSKSIYLTLCVSGFLCMGTASAQTNSPSSLMARAAAFLGLSPTETPPPPVTLLSRVEELFQNSQCLPTEVMKQLSDASIVIPTDLKQILSKDNVKNVSIAEGTAALVLLHTATFKDPVGGKDKVIVATLSDTYRSFDVMKALDTNFKGFYYALDCSGYLTSALSAKVNLGANLSTAASGSMSAKKTITYVRGRLVSPSAVALSPLGYTLLDERAKLGLAFALAAAAVEQGATDDTVISAPQFLEMAWTSSSGSSSLGGETSLTASGEASAPGLASVSGKATAGASITKRINFSDFTSYVFETPSPSISTKLSVLRTRAIQAVNSTRATIRKLDGSLELFTQLPTALCNAGWRVFKSGAKPDEMPIAALAARLF